MKIVVMLSVITIIIISNKYHVVFSAYLVVIMVDKNLMPLWIMRLQAEATKGHTNNNNNDNGTRTDET